MLAIRGVPPGLCQHAPRRDRFLRLCCLVASQSLDPLATPQTVELIDRNFNTVAYEQP